MIRNPAVIKNLRIAGLLAMLLGGYLYYNGIKNAPPININQARPESTNVDAENAEIAFIAGAVCIITSFVAGSGTTRKRRRK